MPTSRAARDGLLLLLSLPAIAALGVLARAGAGVFPQQYAHEFYVVKGCVGLVAVVLLLVHMSRAWNHIDTTDQRLRYLALMVGTVTTGSASTSQFTDDLPVQGVNIAGLLFVVVVSLAMTVSINADH